MSNATFLAVFKQVCTVRINLSWWWLLAKFYHLQGCCWKKMTDSSKSMAFRRLCISWIAICPNAHMLYTLKLRTSFWQIKCATENLWPASSSFNGWENSRIVTWACFSLLPQSQSGPLIVRDLDHEILAAAAAIHSTEPPQMAKSLT